MRQCTEEINSDSALSYYGIAIALGYILTLYVWYVNDGFFYASLDEPWCWPFYSQCRQYRLTLPQAGALFGTIWTFSALTLVFFVYRRVQIATVFLFLTWITMMGLVIQDFRFRSNQFYMLSWITLGYLFVPNKRVCLAVLIVAFYFWAGRLKLNWEWISGSGLYSELWLIPPRYYIHACVYVVLLEMIFIWGILSSSKWLFWITLLQLLLFHLQSFSQVGYWYPYLMFLILSIFPLMRIFPTGSTVSRNSLGYRTGVRTFAVFSIFQLLPLIHSDQHLRVDSTRFLALHMFEARYICNVTIEKNYSGGRTESIKVVLPLAPRMICDPVVYWNYANNRCLEWSNEAEFESLDLAIEMRRSSDQEFKPLYATRCHTQRK